VDFAERRAISPIIPAELFADSTFAISSTIALLGSLVILSAGCGCTWCARWAGCRSPSR
jgi:hypothetical protein